MKKCHHYKVEGGSGFYTAYGRKSAERLNCTLTTEYQHGSNLPRGKSNVRFGAMIRETGER